MSWSATSCRTTSAQSAAATRLIESLTSEDRGFVPIIALVEFGWVLESVYERSRRIEIADGYERILRSRELAVENAEDGMARAAAVRPIQNADLADCLIERSAAAAGCDRTTTFDRKAARDCGMTLVTAHDDCPMIGACPSGTP